MSSRRRSTAGVPRAREIGARDSASTHAHGSCGPPEQRLTVPQRTDGRLLVRHRFPSPQAQDQDLDCTEGAAYLARLRCVVCSGAVPQSPRRRRSHSCSSTRSSAGCVCRRRSAQRLSLATALSGAQRSAQRQAVGEARAAELTREKGVRQEQELRTLLAEAAGRLGDHQKQEQGSLRN